MSPWHLGEDPNTTLGDPQSFTVASDGDEIYFGYDTVKKQLIISTSGAPKGSLAKLQAHWVNQDTLALEYRWLSEIFLFTLSIHPMHLWH